MSPGVSDSAAAQLRRPGSLNDSRVLGEIVSSVGLKLAAEDEESEESSPSIELLRRRHEEQQRSLAQETAETNNRVSKAQAAREALELQRALGH